MKILKNGMNTKRISLNQYSALTDEIVCVIPRFYNGHDLNEFDCRISILGILFIEAGSEDYFTTETKDKVIEAHFTVPAIVTQTAKTLKSQISFLNDDDIVFDDTFEIDIVESIKPETYPTPATVDILDGYLSQFTTLKNEAKAEADKSKAEADKSKEYAEEINNKIINNNDGTISIIF